MFIHYFAHSGFLRKKYFYWLAFDRQTVANVDRVHINEGARRNKQWVRCSRFLFPSSSRRVFLARPIFPSSFPFLAPATQATVDVNHLLELCQSKNLNNEISSSPESLLATNRWPKSLRTLGGRLTCFRKRPPPIPSS